MKKQYEHKIRKIIRNMIKEEKSMAYASEFKEDAPYGKPDPSKYFSVNDGKDYKEFFKTVLQKFRVTTPEELSDDKKKEFFDYVDANWKADQEYDELEEDCGEELDETSSVGAMGGGDGYQTPNAFSKPGSDPKKKRALANNSWNIVEQKIKIANKKYKRRKNEHFK